MFQFPGIPLAHLLYICRAQRIVASFEIDNPLIYIREMTVLLY